MLSVKIIINGSSIEFFKFDKVVAYFLPSFISILIKVVFMLNNTASRIEQRKDRLIVKNIYNINSSNKKNNYLKFNKSHEYILFFFNYYLRF